MKVLGITGGIGSGKSLVCKIFSQLGIPVYEADSEVKKMYQSNEVLIALLHKNFSPGLFNEEGKPDTLKFAAWFFNDDKELEKLNNLVHPYVQEHFHKWCRGYDASPYVIKEAAILFESGAHKDCDRVVTVAAPEELRIKRVEQRDKRSKSDFLKISNRQWSEEERSARADFVITNDESQLVIPQVLNIHKYMMKRAGGEK